MSNLTVFQYSDKEVRTITIDNEPWFVAKDVCEILGISNASQALSRLDADEVVQLSFETIITLNDDPNTARLSAPI